MKFTLLVVLIVLITNNRYFASADQFCGEWQSFGDEKCFQVFKEVGSYEIAQSFCQNQANSSGNLITIKSPEEQKFLETFIFKQKKIVNSVWLGMTYNAITNKFQWLDKTEIRYPNWVQGYPKNETHYRCVQMYSETDEHPGKWINKPCGKSNSIVCEKMQSWSFDKVKNIVREFRQENKDLKNRLVKCDEENKNIKNEMAKSNQNMKSELTTLKQNPVPISFIYVQLPQQPEPKDFWPQVTWQDVSNSYAGDFFRVVGGGAAEFGKKQDDCSPRIVRIRTQTRDPKNRPWTPEEKPISTDSVGVASTWTSGALSTGYIVPDQSNPIDLDLKFSQCEVRPKNQAVKVWKRIK